MKPATEHWAAPSAQCVGSGEELVQPTGKKGGCVDTTSFDTTGKKGRMGILTSITPRCNSFEPNNEFRRAKSLSISPSQAASLRD